MRFAFSGGKPVVILSDLRSTPQGLLFCLMWPLLLMLHTLVIVDRVGASHRHHLVNSIAGPFSTFDILWSAEVEVFNRFT
jgi:hypothetical protein